MAGVTRLSARHGGHHRPVSEVHLTTMILVKFEPRLARRSIATCGGWVSVTELQTILEIWRALPAYPDVTNGLRQSIQFQIDIFQGSTGRPWKMSSSTPWAVSLASTL